MPARSRTNPNRQTAPTPAPVEPVAPTPPTAGRTFPWPLALGVAALVVGLVALGWTLFASGRGASDCQARAWDSIPEERALPDGWAVTATNFFVGNSTITLEGPAADTDTGEGVVYATVTCYGNDGSEALARSRAADASTRQRDNGPRWHRRRGLRDRGRHRASRPCTSAAGTWFRTSWSRATSRRTSCAPQRRRSTRR